MTRRPATAPRQSRFRPRALSLACISLLIDARYRVTPPLPGAKSAFRARAAATRRKRRAITGAASYFPAVYRAELIVPATGWRLKTKVNAKAEKARKLQGTLLIIVPREVHGVTSAHVVVAERKSVHHVAQFVGINYREPASAHGARYLARCTMLRTKGCVRLRVKGRKNTGPS